MTPDDELRHILDKEGAILTHNSMTLSMGFRQQPEGIEAYYFVTEPGGRVLCESNRLGIALAYYRGAKT